MKKAFLLCFFLVMLLHTASAQQPCDIGLIEQECYCNEILYTSGYCCPGPAWQESECQYVVFNSGWETGTLLDDSWSGLRCDTGSEQYVVSGANKVYYGNYAREVKWRPGDSAGGGQDCLVYKYPSEFGYIPGKDYYIRYCIYLEGDPAVQGSYWKNTGQKKSIYEYPSESKVNLHLGTRYMDNSYGYYRAWDVDAGDNYYDDVGGPRCGNLHLTNSAHPSSSHWNAPTVAQLDVHHDWYKTGTPTPREGIYIYEGKWYCVEKFVHKSTTEGEIRVWVDGKEIIRANKETFGVDNYTTGSTIPEQGFQLDSYFNYYNDQVNQTQYERTDDFVISTTYVGPMDIRTPIVSGFADNGATFSIHVTDVDSGVNSETIRLRVNGAEVTNFTIEGTPVDYTITASNPGGLTYTDIEIYACDLGTDNDYDNRLEPNCRSFAVPDSLNLDSDGDGTTDFIGGDNDGDWLPHPDKFNQDYAPEFDLSEVGPEDVFPQHALLATVGRLNIDVDKDSDGAISNPELAQYIQMFQGKKGEAQLPEVIMAASWWANLASDMPLNPNEWRWKDWELEGKKLSMLTQNSTHFIAIGNSIDEPEKVIIFNRKEGQLADITIEIPNTGARTVDFFIVDLKPNQRYNIDITGNHVHIYQSSSEYVSSSDGTLYVSESLGGAICEATGSGKCYYVAVDGSDSNPGTFEEPFGNISHAWSQASPGDFIYIREGIYTEPYKERYWPAVQPSTNPPSGTSGNPITFKPYNNEAVTVQCDEMGVRHPAIGAYNAEYIVWEDITIGYGSTISVWASNNIIIDGCHLQGNNDPSQGWEYTGHNNNGGIRIDSSSNITVRNCKIHGYTGNGHHNNAGIKMYYNDHVTIEHNEIYDSISGIHDKEDNQYSVYRYNLFHDLSSALNFYSQKSNINPEGSHSDHLRWYQNIIYNTGYSGIRVFSAVSGPRFDDAQIYNNVFYDSFASTGAIKLAHATNVSFYNNIVVDSGKTRTDIYDIARWETASEAGCTYSEVNYNCFPNDNVVWVEHYGTEDEATYYGLDGIRNNLGLEMNSIGVGSQPLFVDAENHDFHLRDDSPCKGAGKDGLNIGAYITGNEIIGILDGGETTECTEGQTRSCSTGLQGICSAGEQTCLADGSWGDCVQTVFPETEICDDSTNLDEDCDGLSNCNDSDCTGNENCQACTSIDITITVDDQYDLYLNGNLIGSEHITDGWKSAESYTADLSEGENVLAVLATDTGGAEGILVDASYCGNKLYSNTSWKTSTVLQTGWNSTGFDDSSWESAVDYGAYGVSPWYTNAAGFPTDTEAHWIWAGSGEEIYARKAFLAEAGADCTEDWSCTEWSSCIDGQQTRSCTDANNCGTTQNKPAEQQSCVIGVEIIVAKDGTGDYTTIQEAIDNVLEGQTILVKDGVYDDLVIYEGEQTVIVRIRGSEHPDNVTLKAYPDHRPIILRDEKPLAGNNRAVVLTGISGWTVEGFEIIGGILDIDHGGSSDIKILNNIIRDVYTHTGDNPGMVRIDEAAGNPMGNNNILIKGNTLHGWSCDQPQYSTDCDPPHMGGVAILSMDDYDYSISYEQSTRDIIIEDNEMYDLPKAFFFKNSAIGPYIIRNNYFHDLVWIASVSNREMEFYNNLVINIYPEEFQTKSLGGGFKMAPGRSVPIDYEAWGVGFPNVYNNTFVNFYQLYDFIKMFDSHTNNLVFRTKELSDSMSDKWANVFSFDFETRCQTNYAELSQATVNNNCYVLNEPRSTYRFVNGRWQTPDYYTFDDARSALGIEQDSIFIESATAEEVFENIVDPAPGDHRLPENFLKLKDSFTQCGNIKGANFDYSSWGGQPLLQCLVNLSDCSISMIGGKINSCSLQQLQYEYDATESVQNNVSGLQPNTSYNIVIENLDTGATQTISQTSSSSGILYFTV